MGFDLHGLPDVGQAGFDAHGPHKAPAGGSAVLVLESKAKIVEPVGLVGGFLDATGGGGWGPVVTSNLLIQGHNPRMTVGTVNVAEFFLAIAISATFLLSLGMKDFTAPVIGLLIGGVAAAPLGAWLTKRIPARPLMVLVGVVLTITSVFGIYKTFD